jgi:single-stranded-DNA-specific exonuclease
MPEERFCTGTFCWEDSANESMRAMEVCMLRFMPKPSPGNMPDEVYGLPGWFAAILMQRGVDTMEKAQEFLHPSLSQLHDPFLMQGMDAAVSIIRGAVLRKEPIVVYGDYDVDGVCAASMMLLQLRNMGAKADYYIPSRHDEGYGLNEQAVRTLAKDYRLLLTVDCGITSVKEVSLAKASGMLVIVTDHHQLGPELNPADAVLNPLMGEYPFRRLCGAGVALKLIQALAGLDTASEYLDMAALATIADIVPLTGENRAIAALGLTQMVDTKRPGLKALMAAAGMDVKDRKAVKAGQVAFAMAPRLNAGGRLKSASLGVELMLTADPNRAMELAETLNIENSNRQKLEAEIFEQALNQVETQADFLEDRALIVLGEGWNHGVIGLAASRLTERYHYPSIVLSRTGEECVGSVRSIPGVNIHEMLSACSDLFLRFGGHEQAAGLTMLSSNVPELKLRLSAVIRERCSPDVYVPVREYDLALPLCDVTEGMVQMLQTLQPTGFGNPDPVFLLEDAQVQDMRPVGREGAHLKCSLYKEGNLRSAIAFQMGKMAQNMPSRVDVLFSPELNEWNGAVSVQCSVKAIRSSGEQIPDSEEQAQKALLQEIRGMTANIPKIHPACIEADESFLSRELEGVQGTVILARAPKTARRISLTYGERLLVTDRISDRRAFHTLLYPARLTELTDIWRTVILADGELMPGEAALIEKSCPRAKVVAYPRSLELTEFLKPLALCDDSLRRLYKTVRSHVGASPVKLAETAGLNPAQLMAGLHILMEMELLVFQEEPFTLAMLPVKKRSTDESSLLKALKTLSI